MNNIVTFTDPTKFVEIVSWCRREFGADIWPPQSLSKSKCDWTIDTIIWDDPERLVLKFVNDDNATLCSLRWS